MTAKTGTELEGCEGHEATTCGDYNSAIGSTVYCDGTCESCPDCGGRLRVAFNTTKNYLSCRRCGHVFASAS